MNGDDELSKYEKIANKGLPLCPYRHNYYDRVLVLMDLRNVSMKISGDCQEEFEYGKLLIDAVGIRNLVAAIAVDGTFYEDEDRLSRLQSRVRNCGFRIESVPVTNNSGKQEGTDVALALIAFEYAIKDRCDTIVLITGDGDFTYLVKKLQGLGKVVEVISFDESLSGRLRRAADKVTLLDGMPLISLVPNEEEADL